MVCPNQTNPLDMPLLLLVTHNAHCLMSVKLSTFPDNDGHVAAKEHVQNVLDLVCYFKAEALANDDLPRWPKLLVH